MLTLADVPLDVRVGAALEVLMSESGLDVPGRYALVYAALWPDTATTPVFVPTPTIERGARRSWPAEIRTAAITAYMAGAESYATVGARWGVPGNTLKDWVRHARRA